eukprot:15432806-Alexandrium_andersonii.AAC.1
MGRRLPGRPLAEPASAPAHHPRDVGPQDRCFWTLFVILAGPVISDGSGALIEVAVALFSPPEAWNWSASQGKR